MEKDLLELESILKAEQNLLSVYLEELTDQQNYLIENDLDGLKNSIRELNLLAQKALTLENGRKAVIKRISLKLNMGNNDVTLSNLLARFEGRNFDELERLRNTILDVHIKVTARKECNELLINQSMNVIKQTVDYLNDRNNSRITFENTAVKGGNGNDRKGLLSKTA